MRALLTLVVLLGGMLGGSAQTVSTAPPPKLRPGDVVSITVFTYVPFGGDFLVFDDGSINGPGFGHLPVEGLTLDEVKKAVEGELSKSLKDPAARVVLKSQKRQVVYVIGLGAQEEGNPASAVEHSGSLPITPGMTIRQLVAAITLPSEPDLVDATLHRKKGEQFPIDLLKLVRGDKSQWNGLVEPDDTLIILPKPYIRIWLLGAVKAPGEVRVRAGLDVHKALASFGGAAGTGDLPEEMTLTVKRGPNTYPLPLTVEPGSPEFLLEAGDALYIEPVKKIRITVGGNVASPGTYLLNDGSGIGRLVAEAHGLTPEGSLAGAMVMRGPDMYRVDATGPSNGKVDAPFLLETGDFVFVPHNRNTVYALGQVGSPGRFLVPDGQSWRAADLLAKANGLGGKGTLRRINLLRAGPDGKVVARQFNLDEYLKDGKIESNPELLPGDVLFFGEPRGFSLNSLSLIGQAAFYFDSLFGIGR